MAIRDLPDMYALSPRACGPRAYISGKSLMAMLQLLHTSSIYPKPKSINILQKNHS